jgi:signal transduction histidine kinase
VNLAHQWRQPLNTAGLVIQKQMMDYDDGVLTSDSFHKTNDSVLQELTELSDTISKFTRVYEDNEFSREANIKNCMEKALDLLKGKSEQYNLHVNSFIVNDFTADISEQHLTDIFTAIIDNIYWISSQKENLKPEITVTARSDNHYSEIRIEDNLGGIPEHILPDIFHPYTTTRFRSRNKGMGLFHIYQIITEIYNGTIVVKNTSKGAEFIIRIPENK